MEKLPCSIFNDVLGPVMRGPSSSHVAGAARIASMIRQSLDAPVKKAIVDFDVNGALAASHTGHGTDMGFASGLLNMELDAASVGLQNITGLACDPVGNRVEWPCLGKNIMGGSNALASANMILAGYDKVIPLDETIGAIYEIGLSLPLELRCTFGGLGKTKGDSEAVRRAFSGGRGAVGVIRNIVKGQLQFV